MKGICANRYFGSPWPKIEVGRRLNILRTMCVFFVVVCSTQKVFCGVGDEKVTQRTLIFGVFGMNRHVRFNFVH